MNFRSNLVPDARFPWRVRQQSRIEERDQRRRNGFRPPIGQAADDAAEQLAGLYRAFGGEASGARHVPNHVDQAAREVDSDRRSFRLVDRCNGLTDHARQVESNSIGGLGRPQVPPDGLETVAEAASIEHRAPR
jgi:hypothetical protein